MTKTTKTTGEMIFTTSTTNVTTWPLQWVEFNQCCPISSFFFSEPLISILKFLVYLKVIWVHVGSGFSIF
jgi:hypothetical protein